MMYETLEGLLKGTCDAIREKDGTTALIAHQDIPEKIRAIPSGSGGDGFPSVFYTYGGAGGVKIDNMVASNFSGSYGIFLDEPFLPGDSTWEIVVKFTWPTDTRNHALFGSWKGYYYAPTLEVGSGNTWNKIWVGIPDGSNAWKYEGNSIVSYAVKGENYWIKLRFDGEKYVISLSKDSIAFEDIIQIDYNTMYQNEIYTKLSFGGIAGSSNHYFTGSIDLKETYIKIGDEIWWGRR